MFKFRCNIFIVVRIIKEMSGSVASGTPCISECLSVALLIQHTKRKLLIILSPVASPSLLYFALLSHTRHEFQEKRSY
jgi:hypothetical protein